MRFVNVPFEMTFELGNPIHKFFVDGNGYTYKKDCVFNVVKDGIKRNADPFDAIPLTFCRDGCNLSYPIGMVTDIVRGDNNIKIKGILYAAGSSEIIKKNISPIKDNSNEAYKGYIEAITLNSFGICEK